MLCRKLDQVMKQYVRNEIDHITWLDALTLAKVDALRQQASHPISDIRQLGKMLTALKCNRRKRLSITALNPKRLCYPC